MPITLNENALPSDACKQEGKHTRMSDYLPVGELLVASGRITREQLDHALETRSSSRKRIGERLVEMGYATEMDVAKCLGRQFGFPVVDPRRLSPTREALALLSAETAVAHRILPIQSTGDRVECSIADPIDFPTTDMIARIAGKRVVISISPATGLVNCIRRAYGLQVDPPRTLRTRIHDRVAPKPQVDRRAILAALASAENLSGRMRAITVLETDTAQAGGAS